MNDLIPESIGAELRASLLAPNPYLTIPMVATRVPLTRRMRVELRLLDVRERIALAWDALRGRHECER